TVARARAASLLTQSNFSKYYHGLEMERAQLLVLALCGHFGRKGAGPSVFPAMTIAGASAAIVAPGSLPPKAGAAVIGAKVLPRILAAKWRGEPEETVLRDLAAEECASGRYVSGVLFEWFHGGLEQLYGSAPASDPYLPRPTGDYLREALARRWQHRPARARQRVFFEVGGNLLRRARGHDRLRRAFLSEVDTLVTLDWRMSSTALASDYVLPAAAWYEKDDITWATPLVPFAHPTTAAVRPYREAKTDWEFHCELLATIERRARERGIKTFTDRSGRTRRLDQVYREFSFGYRFGERDAPVVLDELLGLTTNLGGTRWGQLKKRGFARYSALGLDFINTPNATDLTPGDTITAGTWHTEKKIPWPTLTRRIQFYVDHPWFLELGEELPAHKDPPPFGGDYPLALTTQHARWSIHASWRDAPELLRLDRGEPVVRLNPRDARSRAIGDGDMVRVYNDLGAFFARAKLAPSIQPGQVVIEHAWEPYQFVGHRSHQSLVAGAVNPLQLAGGYEQLCVTPVTGQPGSADRATRVEVEPARARAGRQH
ncbi:MAG: hypothetical protein D6815_08360, partial [Candidatus Dadabacteria bacterium]